MKSVDQGDISQSVSYSFQPNLDRRSSGYTHSDLAPIYKRLHEIVSAKREHLKALAS